MFKKNIKYFTFLILFIVLLLSSFATVNAAIGKKTYAKNKYIWVYINGERKIIPSGYGYPCYGQGTDNKNILYIPLSILTDMTGCEISPLKKEIGENGEYKYSAEVSGNKSFSIELYSDTINGIKLAGKTFILKGTDAARTNVIMVPLGFAKDCFGLETEVKRPIGRGVFDYCSLAINIKSPVDAENGGTNNDNNNNLLTPPNNNQGGGDENNTGSDTIYFVHAEDIFYHLGTCTTLQNDTLRAQLSEYECIYWGYQKCPSCLGENYTPAQVNSPQPINMGEPIREENIEISGENNSEENFSDDGYGEIVPVDYFG